MVRLLDQQGRVLRNISLGANQKEIQVSNLAKGQYLLQIISDQENYTEKIWIQ